MRALYKKLGFPKRLLSLIDSLKPETVIVQEAVSIQQLATLTKLVVRHQQCLRGIKLERSIIVVVL